MKILLDPNVHVLVAITGYQSSNHADYVLIKYAPADGTEIWNRNWGVSGDFQARCKAGSRGNRLQAQLTLIDTSHSGENVTISLDGEPFVIPISGNRAKLSIKESTTGPPTIELTDPAAVSHLSWSSVRPSRSRCPSLTPRN